MRVVWHLDAQSDLDAIQVWLVSKRPRAARALRDAIAAAIELAREYPLAGRVAIGFRGDESLRELLVSNYRILYRVDADRLLVLRVWDGRREGTPEIAGERIAKYYAARS